MKRRLISALCAIGVGVAAVAGLAPAAHADSLTKFVPYTAHVDWYAPTPATVASPFAAPQTTKVLTCGGIHQADDYTITSKKLDAEYRAFVAAGVLNSPAEDAKFNPHDYTVTALPDCVVVPPQPADKVEVTTNDGNPDCVAGTVPVTTTTTTTPFVYDEKSNTWVEGTPVVTSSTATREATQVECPPVVVIPDKPADIVTVSHTTLKPFCDGTTAVATEETSTTTIGWTYNAESNTYVKLAPVTVTTNHEVKTPGAPECAAVVTPPTKPTPPVVKPTPPVKPTPVVTKPTPKPAPVLVVAKPKPTHTAAPVATVAAPKGLAFTGSDATTPSIVGGMIVGLGLFLFFYGRHANHMANLQRKAEGK